MQNVNRMVGYNTAVGTLAEIAVDATTGKVTLLTHHTILECGNMLVPQLVTSQLQGGVASGIGLALYEELPLYEDGPGDGTWNFNRYHLPRGGHVAVWAQTAEVLPPLSDDEPPKGMAEVAGIPIIPAIVNGIAHAIGHRFRTLPVTPDRILEVLA
jgi:CO/xanthine dehydrogenase Mo-binding subunit